MFYMQVSFPRVHASMRLTLKFIWFASLNLSRVYDFMYFTTLLSTHTLFKEKLKVALQAPLLSWLQINFIYLISYLLG